MKYDVLATLPFTNEGICVGFQVSWGEAQKIAKWWADNDCIASVELTEDLRLVRPVEQYNSPERFLINLKLKVQGLDFDVGEPCDCCLCTARDIMGMPDALFDVRAALNGPDVWPMHGNVPMLMPSRPMWQFGPSGES